MRPDEVKAFAAFCRHAHLAIDDFTRPEPPDFLAKDGSLAVELVGYHRDDDCKGQHGSEWRKAEVDMARVIRRAQHLCPCSGRVDVYIFIDRSQRLSDREAGAKALADIVLRHADDLPENGIRIPLDDSAIAPVTWLEIYPAASHAPRPVWDVAEAAIIDARLPAIRSTIAGKELKLEAYRREAREVWLLIHASPRPAIGLPNVGRRFSSCGSITAELRTARFPTAFDAIYYLELDARAGGECMRLHTIKHQRCSQGEEHAN